MTTQTIYRATHTSNYSVLPNAIPSNTSLSAHARLALIYLLGKPPTWKMRITDVKRAIGCGINKAYRCLNELIKAGYAKMIRGQSRVDWFFYDVPQTSVESNRDGFNNDGNGDVLVNTEHLVNTEINNYEPAINQVKQSVVVSNAGAEDRPPIPLPDSLKGSQVKAARKLLSNITHEQAAMVLMVFNAAMQAKRVNNPIGYFHQLVNAAKSDSLTAPQAARKQTLDDRITKQREARKQSEIRSKVDNASFFEMMRQKYGERFQVPI